VSGFRILLLWSPLDVCYAALYSEGMIAPTLFGDCSAVHDVWAETAQDAFVDITALLHRDSEVNYMIGIDLEFAIPDSVVSLGREPPLANVHYEELCKTVNGGNLVQVGFAVVDANFNVLGVWQFNLQFQSALKFASATAEPTWTRLPPLTILHNSS
jgi:hypothetical protein